MGRAFGLSGRRLSTWHACVTKDKVSYATLLRYSRQIEVVVNQIRRAELNIPLKTLILDGIWFERRGVGKQLLLVALGVDDNGKVHVLDWLVSKSESHRNWLTLL